MCVNAEIFGATLDWHRRFKVSSVGLSRWHQSNTGNLLLTLARMEMKWALNV
jgi:hypothetical protein